MVIRISNRMTSFSPNGNKYFELVDLVVTNLLIFLCSCIVISTQENY